MNKVNFLIFGDNNEERFKVYKSYLDRRQVSYVNVDYSDFLKNKMKIPNLEGKVCVRVFSPWYTSSAIDYFAQIGETPEGFDYHIAKGNSFYSNTPQVTNGFYKFLKSIEEGVNRKVESPQFVNPPHEIYMGRNKREMAKHFLERGIEHPKTHLEVRSPSEVFDLKDKEHYNGLFVKLSSGSLGRGIAVVEGNRIYTTVKKENGVFCTGKEQRLITNEREIEEILKFILDMGAVVQESVPLDFLDNKDYMIRHYVVHGEVPLSDLTISSGGKITNACIGAEQIVNERIKNYLSEDKIKKSEEFAKRVSSTFESNDLGLDIGFIANSDKMVCFEANFVSGLGPHEKFIYDLEITKNLQRLRNE